MAQASKQVPDELIVALGRLQLQCLILVPLMDDHEQQGHNALRSHA